MSAGYVYRDPARRVTQRQRMPSLHPLTADAWKALTPDERAVRQDMWRFTINILRADHERRYAVEARRAEVLAEADANRNRATEARIRGVA